MAVQCVASSSSSRLSARKNSMVMKTFLPSSSKTSTPFSLLGLTKRGLSLISHSCARKPYRNAFKGGKGGAGKTSCATSDVVVKYVNHGHPTNVVSTDPAHSLSDSFAQGLTGGMLVQVEGPDTSMFSLEINPEKEREKLRSASQQNGGTGVKDFMDSMDLGMLVEQSSLEKRETDSGAARCEEKKNSVSDQYVKDFERQLLYWPGCVFLSLYPEEEQDALALAKKAVLASKEAASLAEETNLLGEDITQPFLGLEPHCEEREITVRSGKLLERRCKKRGVSKSKVIIHESPSLKMVDMHRKMNEGFDSNDPLRLFLSGSGTRQLLTAKQEQELFVEIRELAKLEEVKGRLQSQFGREPTLIEWAEAVGMSCLALQSHIHSGNRSRERMTCSNFRLVVHVAKHYQGWGMSLQDLLQEGSKGLMKSVEKFKPQAGCRFSTYAYWWIRQSIKKSIFQNSRTIRLPENVYHLMKQVKNVRRQCLQDGSEPTNEELARRMGISVEKLISLLVSTRMPISIQQTIWADQDATFQEVTADSEVERPDQCVAKQMMRQHVRSFLNILSPKERLIIRLRFGIEDGKQKSLSQIGLFFGISKERVRQLESRALDKLKRSMSTQGLEAYTNLLV